ncbi:hypothetical protein CDAR_312911 [Caerostris darwini]|uniref:Uncharacterized protein n=1 Tax=Caerostris darwini TaxID=1538125 RepID=A0AAV4S3E3_9ARAC|nr:hypothetical protein CDAR_312911 [Caerostris darwini]
MLSLILDISIYTLTTVAYPSYELQRGRNSNAGKCANPRVYRNNLDTNYKEVDRRHGVSSATGSVNSQPTTPETASFNSNFRQLSGIVRQLENPLAVPSTPVEHLY